MVLNKKILPIFMVWAIFGCNIYDTNYGFITTSVKFKTKSFSLKAIPPETSKIKVSVSGVGLDNPIEFELSQEETRRVVRDVPSGEKEVLAQALGAEDQVLAEGSEKINIIGGQNNVIEITLASKPLIKPSISPSPTLSPSPSTSEIPTNQPSSPSSSTSIVPTIEPTPTPSASESPVSSGSSSSSTEPSTNNIQIQLDTVIPVPAV